MSKPEFSSEATSYLWAWQEVTSAMLAHPGIIIVGYHGWIVGGGFEHTLACDIRVASDDTRIMLPELGMGLFFSNASTKLLTSIVGMGRAKELMMLGGELKAEEALKIGLVNHVCKREELDNVMQGYAKTILAKDPLMLQLAKQMINRAQENTIPEVLYNEGREMMHSIGSESTCQRIGAFLESKSNH